MPITFDVDREWTKGGSIFVHVGESTAREIFVMRGPEYKDSFNIMWFGHVLVAPCSSRPTVIITGMRANDCFDLLGSYFFFSSSKILPQLCI